MVRRYRPVLTILVLILSALLILVCFFPKHVEIIDDTPYKNKIDSLENVINELQNKKDSIKIEIDTVYLKIADNTKRYEETRNDIINNTVNEDFLFFSNYIRKQQERFDSYDNI